MIDDKGGGGETCIEASEVDDHPLTPSGWWCGCWLIEVAIDDEDTDCADCSSGGGTAFGCSGGRVPFDETVDLTCSSSSSSAPVLDSGILHVVVVGSKTGAH